MAATQSNLTRAALILFLLSLLSMSCSFGLASEPVGQPKTDIQIASPTREVAATKKIDPPITATLTTAVQASATASVTPTITPSVTITPTVTRTPTITPINPNSPGFKFPRARVKEQANCRYGPGVAYLYKYGLFPGNRIEVIGRNDPGAWVYIRGIGGTNACWVSAKVLEFISGEIFNVAPTTSVLPMSDLYQPPVTVSAVRKGNNVTVSWTSVWMTEDDYRGYLIEAWICQNGDLVFTPVRSDDLIYNFTDEPGCAEPSKGRVYTAEKHGYTKWRAIPWPPFK